MLGSVKAAAMTGLSLGTVEGGTLGVAGLATGREALLLAAMTAATATVMLLSKAQTVRVGIELGKRLERERQWRRRERSGPLDTR